MRSMLRIFFFCLIFSLLIASIGAAINVYSHRSGRSLAAAQSSSVVTVIPTSYQSPFYSGDFSVSSPSNTGHGTTNAWADSSSIQTSEDKSCRWFAFQPVSGTITRITLKFDWSVNGGVRATTAESWEDSAFASAQFSVLYSTNNGSNVTYAIQRGQSASAVGPTGYEDKPFSDSGSFSVDLPANTPINQIIVQDRLMTEASESGLGNGSATVNATISDIQLEVETWNCVASVPTDRWKGEYFNNQTLSGSPTMVRDDTDPAGFLNLNFVAGGAHSVCAPLADNFSARWTRTVNLAQGIYRFTVAADNGVRLYVDGYPRIDQWGNLPPNTYTADVFLSAGDHEIKLEFIEYTGAASVSLSWTTVSGTNCYAGVPANRWKGEYFSNTDLSGSPAMARDDGAGFLDRDFSGGGPGGNCGLDVDYFSARWTRTVNFANGTYRFTALVDDGVRLYVDGQLKIDAWVIQAPTTYTADVYLPAGDHQIRLEFFEAWSGARASVSWADIRNCQATVAADRWRGEYFNNINLSGGPWMVRDEGAGFLNFNFGAGGPGGGCGLGVDNFSARWTRPVNFAAGVYRFSVTVDDGARLYIDGLKIIDAWGIQAPTTYTADHSLSAGAHEVKLEYFESGGGASVSLSWADVTNCVAIAPPDRWKGEYYNNTTLAGSPAMARDDGAGFLNFNFGAGGPGGNCGLGVDNFSARWTRTVNFGAGVYRFSVTGDNGVKLYVDGQLKINFLSNLGPVTTTADVTFTSAGPRQVKLEYVESFGLAVAILSWADLTGMNCLPDTPLPLISSVPQAGGRENIASTAPSQAPKRCGQKIVAAPRAPGSD